MSKASDLGERRIIEILIENLDQMPNMPVPFGDDVSAVSLDTERLAVLKTDMLVGKTDVPPGMTLWQAARKTVVMNVSDLAAKGVQPIAILTSLGLPRDLNKADIEEIASGLNAGAREYGAYVIGGDTGEASDLVICCMVFGITAHDTLIPRSGAKPGDILAVTGSFGKTGAGFKILLKGLETPPKLKERILEAVYMPKAHLKEGVALAKSGVVSASIDSSDGLAISLHELRKMSNCGFQVKEVPVAEEVEEFAELHGLNGEQLALFGGEEYELVVTVKPEMWKRAKKIVREIQGVLIPIGEVSEDTRILRCNRETSLTIPYEGWEHFKT